MCLTYMCNFFLFPRASVGWFTSLTCKWHDRGIYSIRGGRSLYCLHFGFSQFMRPWEGKVVEEKRKKQKDFSFSFWYPIQGPGRMAHAPLAGTSDSASRFRRYHCSTLINYYTYFLVGEQFCFQLLCTT